MFGKYIYLPKIFFLNRTNYFFYLFFYKCHKVNIYKYNLIINLLN